MPEGTSEHLIADTHLPAGDRSFSAVIISGRRETKCQAPNYDRAREMILAGLQPGEKILSMQDDAFHHSV